MLARGVAGLAAEPVTEIFLRGESAEFAYVAYLEVGMDQHFPGAYVADSVNIFFRGGMKLVAEEAEKCDASDFKFVRQFGD